jgi:hypothetical protein
LKHHIISYTIIAAFCVNAAAQNIQLKLGPDQIALNETFTITLEVQNDRLNSYDPFPEIDGFQKMGTSSSSSTNIINGQYSFSQSIIQNYRPLAQGVYTLSPFSMLVNGQEVQSPGKTIRVGPAAQQQRPDVFSDPFEDFFGRSKPKEFMEVRDDAFFALTTDKSEVYVGEGFTVTLAFYVAETNRADLSFYETGQQLAEMKKKITPSNCWEENFNIEKSNREDVMINDKRYGRYKIFQAAYYPFNTEEIEFPQLALKMIKYKVAKNPSFFGRNRQEDFKTFYSEAKSVHVRPLPQHPLSEVVPVGRYALDEKISENDLETGRSFNYTFSIRGEGNISAVNNPTVRSTNNFDFYPPNIRQNIMRGNNRVTGTKTFNYQVIPNEPGSYHLGDYIYLVYFDPYRESYDTLLSDIEISVTGESKKNVAILSNDVGSFYDIIELESNTLRNRTKTSAIQWIANVFIVFLLGITVYIMIRKP